MLLFSNTVVVSLEAWDRGSPLWHVAKGPIVSFLRGICMARGRTTSLTIRLTPMERQTLLAWQRATTIAAGRARRGRIILLVADRVPISDVATTVGISRRFIYKWVQRFMQDGLDGLSDKPGRGHRRVLPQPVVWEQHDMSA